MREMSRLFPLLLLLVASCCAPEPPRLPAQDFSLIWRLENALGHATGTPILWEEGRLYLVTAKHALGADREPPPIAHNIRSGAILGGAQRHWTSPDDDLAIVSYSAPESCGVFSISPAATTPVDGSTIYVAGHPHREPPVAFCALACGPRLITGSFAPGMSGGPVLDDSGTLVGILVQYHCQITAQMDRLLWGTIGGYVPIRLLPPREAWTLPGSAHPK